MHMHFLHYLQHSSTTTHTSAHTSARMRSPPALQDGRRDGIGIKTYADGSMYDGFWRAGKKHGLGVFRPAPEETSSRRHSNHMGWQPQQQRASGAGSPEGTAPVDLAAQSAFAEQELAAASVSSEAHDQAVAAAATAAVPAAAASAADGVQLQDLRHINSSVGGSGVHPTDALQQQQPQPQQQQPVSSAQQQRQGGRDKAHLVSPFLAAAAALNSETSIIGEPPRLANGSWQQQPLPAELAGVAAAAAAAAAASNSGAGAAAAGADKAAAAGADAGIISGIPAAAAAAAAGGKAAAGETATDSTSLVPAGGLLGTGAPRKLFVREYNIGQLVREYPLTAEEIKMIFGFLWPKANKVRPVGGMMGLVILGMEGLGLMWFGV